MASALELLTMRDVYREIISDLKNSVEKDLYFKYEDKLKDIEGRLENLRRG